jgi:hypothetical protein
MAFTTKIRRARFVVSPFSAQQMVALGTVLRDSIRTRIQHGLNVDDQAAKRLSFDRKGSYGRQKVRAGKLPIRDWTWSGRTLGAMNVLNASENRAEIGFSDPIAAARARWNNARERQFGISPNDRVRINQAVRDMIRAEGIVRAGRVA